MSDFSMFAIFTAGLACLAPFASAYTKPTGDAPIGNPIFQPGLNSLVPAGTNFSVTWDPTTEGTVSIVLLKGPSDNVIPQYAIAEKIKNSGIFSWAVKDDIAPSDGPKGYGLQLIDDATGQYQYSTQFGISNPDYEAPKESSSSAPSYPHGYGSTTSSLSWSATSVGALSTGAASSGWPVGNSSVIQPTVPMTMPTSLATFASPTVTVAATSTAAATTTAPSAPAATTNAAGTVATSFAGLVIAAGVAVFAL